MKENVLGVGIAVIAYGMLLFVARLIKKPILCGNIYLSFLFLGIFWASSFDYGKTFFTLDSLILLLFIIIFFLILLAFSGIKYYVYTGVEALENELVSLGFTHKEYEYSDNIKQFIAPNGTRLLYKTFKHSKFLEVSILNGFRFKKLNDTRKMLIPFIKQNHNQSSFEGIVIIGVGLVSVGISFLIK